MPSEVRKCQRLETFHRHLWLSTNDCSRCRSYILSSRWIISVDRYAGSCTRSRQSTGSSTRRSNVRFGVVWPRRPVSWSIPIGCSNFSWTYFMVSNILLSLWILKFLDVDGASHPGELDIPLDRILPNNLLISTGFISFHGHISLLWKDISGSTIGKWSRCFLHPTIVTDAVIKPQLWKSMIL